MCIVWEIYRNMRFHVVTLFPNMFESYLSDSILKRANEAKKVSWFFYNPREESKDKWKRVDDRPYGGGPGMVMTPDPILRAVEKINKKIARFKKTKVKTVIFSPGGISFTNTIAQEVVSKKTTDIILICGRYEGIDARVKKILKAEEWSVGEYVLTGGELPAMIVIDAVSRHIDGVLGNNLSPEENRVSSHETYTRPETFIWKKKKYIVPEVLLSGDHKKIDAWKNSQK